MLLLTALRRKFPGSLEVTVFEPRAELGLGAAYATRCPLHLLNTRATNMSATDVSDDFLKWLRSEHPRRPINWTRSDFAPRELYGLYLQAQVKDVQAASHMRLKWLRSTVDSLVDRAGEWQVVPAQGNPVLADVVVLATGNEAPRATSAQAAPYARSFIVDDPWASGALDVIERDAPVLLVGTGLSAVDIAVELLQRGHTGAIHALSRRGLLPRCHAPTGAARNDDHSALPGSLRALVRHVRAAVESDPRGTMWQAMVNEMRTVAPALWARWTAAERGRFLRHVRPFWDVHRHRIAPAVHARIKRAQKRGQLTLLRGRISDIELTPLAHAARVRFRHAGGAERRLDVARVINCTGPEVDLRRTSNPLLQSLVSDSLVGLDPLGLGLSVEQHCRVISSQGSAHRTLYALGPLTRGSRWEVTAIAEIRNQAADIVRKLARDFAAAADRRALRAAPGVYPSMV